MADEHGEDPRAADEMPEAPRGDREELDGEEEDASSPFDHPAFLPVILIAVALWFGFDGWFNPETESIRFNRYGFGFLAGAAVYFSLDEYARVPYLLPLLCLGYAVWLGALALLGPPGAWYNDDSTAQMFNRHAAMGFLALAAVTALRETVRRRRADTEKPGA
jgi:hypothetical protein